MHEPSRQLSRTCGVTLFILFGTFLVNVAASEAADIDATTVQRINAVVTDALDEGEACGVVIAIGSSNGLTWQNAWDEAQTLPKSRPMQTDSVFDLASLTKPIATATAVMQLAERGRLDLDAPVAKYLPDFGANGKQEVTVTDLLTHQGGLIADNALRDYLDGETNAWKRINALSLRHQRRERFVYSDVGFLVLGQVVEAVSGQSLDAYCRENIFAPLDMNDTGFVPPPRLQKRAVATERRDGRWLVGEVHDPRAAALHGVAGHAGLFSTAADLSRFATALLCGGELNGDRILSEESVKKMTTGVRVPGENLRGLGWDVKSAYSSNRSPLYSATAFGHGGFTGTSLWLDPASDLFVIFLSSRLHPDGKGRVNALAAEVGTIVLSARGE